MKKKNGTRFVYFAKARATGLIKIGSAVNVPKRLKELSTMSPDPLELLGVVPESQYTEETVHQMFAKSRDHGEWFMPTAGLDVFIASRAKPWTLYIEPIPPAASWMNTPSALAAVIRRRRTQHGLNQADLAELAHTSRKFVNQLEKCHSRAELGLVLSVVRALGIRLKAD